MVEATTDGKMALEAKDHRVALVEDASGILLRIGMDESSNSSGRDVQVRLLIGAGVASWSTLADYPRRVPLHHCDALIHYTAAQSVSHQVLPHSSAQTNTINERISFYLSWKSPLEQGLDRSVHLISPLIRIAVSNCTTVRFHSEPSYILCLRSVIRVSSLESTIDKICNNVETSSVPVS